MGSHCAHMVCIELPQRGGFFFFFFSLPFWRVAGPLARDYYWTRGHTDTVKNSRGMFYVHLNNLWSKSCISLVEARQKLQYRNKVRRLDPGIGPMAELSSSNTLVAFDLPLRTRGVYAVDFCFLEGK